MGKTLILKRIVANHEGPGGGPRREEVGRLELRQGKFRIARLDPSIDRALLERTIAQVEATGVWALGSDPKFKEPELGARSQLWIKLSPRYGRAYLSEFGRSLSDNLANTPLSSLRASPPRIGPISPRWSATMLAGTGLSLLLVLTFLVRTWAAFLLGVAVTEALVSALALTYVFAHPGWLLRLFRVASALLVVQVIATTLSLLASELLPLTSATLMAHVVAASPHGGDGLVRLAAGLVAAGLALYGAYALRFRELRVLLCGAAAIISGCAVALLLFSWITGIVLS